tara:strand:+ start:3108 stop:4019 length:912 start_codon:yes stop_codon:yes gene_type:complete
MKILLTGATGFLGKNLMPILSEKYGVSGVGSTWDLRNQESCGKLLDKIEPDVVVHAAGTVGGIGANKENPGKFMYENLIMGTNMIHESMKRSVSKFVLLGTVCSYPKHTEVPFKEEDIWNGYPEETNAPYGIAKKTLMQMLISYKEQYGFNGVNLIPVNMYGPHDHFNLTSSHVIPALILKVHNAVINKQDEIVIWGTGNASREFLFAEDCAEVISLALEKDISPSPINIGTGSEIKIIDLVKIIADIMNFQGIIRCDESKPDGQPRRCLDTSKAKKLLGFEAKTDLSTGLQKTIDWFLKIRG